MDTVLSFADNSPAKVSYQGDITEITIMEHISEGSPCRKVDRDHYIDIRDNRLCEYQHIENRAQCLKSVRASLKRIRELINTNVTVPERVRWVTLTYAECMTDTKRLYSDFHAFWKRFCYWCKKEGYSKPEYISVIEPQARGAWHVHAFFIWPCSAPFVPADDLARLWGFGFVKIKALDNVDNAGAYFTAYLADLPLDEIDGVSIPNGSQIAEKFVLDDNSKPVKKKILKGGRLCLYPPGTNIVRRSRGISDPVSIRTIAAVAEMEKATAGTVTFSGGYSIFSDGNLINRVSISYYNKRR